MKQLKTITGIIFLIFTIYSCDKTEWFDPDKPTSGYLDEIPKETRNGANTFGCFINGEIAAAQGIFQEKGLEFAPTHPYVNGFWDRYKDIYVIPDTWTSKDTIITEMRLKLNSKHYNMQITIANHPFLGTNDCTFYIRCNSLLNQSGRLKEASVDITTFNKERQVISGRFDNIDFHFEDFLVHITKGQFDINYGKNF